MVSITPQNHNAMFRSCRFNKCEFWQWFTTSFDNDLVQKFLIYPNSSDQVVDNQNLELNTVNFRADDVVKIKKRLRVIEGRVKCIILMIVCVCAIVFTKV